jgi:hypothetical protein
MIDTLAYYVFVIITMAKKFENTKTIFTMLHFQAFVQASIFSPVN